jgi:hypothetical protein
VNAAQFLLFVGACAALGIAIGYIIAAILIHLDENKGDEEDRR